MHSHAESPTRAKTRELAALRGGRTLLPRPTSPVMDDRRPLGSRFQDTCRQTREGGGLPEGSTIPPGITHDLILQFDLPAARRSARSGCWPCTAEN